jgi:hypothetical protein
MSTKKSLVQRQNIDKARYSITASSSYTDQIQQSIIQSWNRSDQANIPTERQEAPITKIKSKQSAYLRQALDYCQEQLQHITLQSSMVMAVADIGSTIIWTTASRPMQKAAENVNFVEGGYWDETQVGTNALALSLKTKQSSCVFSNEHYMTSVHDWVCYATPIIEPYTQQVVGVLDLSTTWQNHNQFGLLAAERCASILQSALQECQKHYIYIQGFNSPSVIFNGRHLRLTPRQNEILAVLALCPQGMNLECLHQAIYGERKVSQGTLKAEMSQLRDTFTGLIGSRPYRLLMPVDGDFLRIEQALNAGYVEAAIKGYSGTFFSKTESPFLCAWRHCLEARLSQAIYNSDQVDLLLQHLANCPDASDAIERLIELMPNNHSIHQLLYKI